ncbi:formate dehydrogenase accessory sulfurtransferase FdhD [Acidithiobacillus ferrivorans]|uniref:formate dehydrogenase accessory sulfurtransferase FdhD n=1 Tax=Acidithiobacillus ferrivorans TaxID=160808 RepID=UPI0002E04733|nr:formate dehydrogenase accessory sulfurtransferase FdhD [Acidithiobacillus ferrivorans]
MGLHPLSGVSSLAIQLAESHGLTLIGYARDRRMTVYAHGERIRGCSGSIPMNC